MSEFKEDLRTLRAHLDKLTALMELVRLSGSKEERARMERTIQFVSSAFQTMTQVRLQNGDAERKSGETAETELLCQKIVAEARAAGLCIGDNDNWR